MPHVTAINNYTVKEMYTMTSTVVPAPTEAEKRLERVVQEALKHDPYSEYWKKEVDKARTEFMVAMLIAGSKSTQNK